MVAAACFALISFLWFMKRMLRFLTARAVDQVVAAGERQLVKGVSKIAEGVKKADPARIDTEVARLAKERQGVLTVSEVMASLQMSQFDSQEALARAVRKRLCKIEAAVTGSRYVFDSFLPTSEQVHCPFCDTLFNEAPADMTCGNCGGALSKKIVKG